MITVWLLVFNDSLSKCSYLVILILLIVHGTASLGERRIHFDGGGNEHPLTIGHHHGVGNSRQSKRPVSRGGTTPLGAQTCLRLRFDIVISPYNTLTLNNFLILTNFDQFSNFGDFDQFSDFGDFDQFW